MKNIFKSTLAVAAIAAVGMGSYKAYGSYVAANLSESELLLAENVLAIGEPSPAGDCKQKGDNGFCSGRSGGGHYICKEKDSGSHCTIHCGVPHKH